jgi:flagellar hook-basal body complex protein FliE
VAVQTVDFIPATHPVAFDPVGSAESGASGFASWLDHELSQVNQQLLGSDVQMRSLAAGDVENLHQVMMSLEKAKLSFELVVQVRNRLLEAYQDVMRMQV